MGKRTQPRIYVILQIQIAELFRHGPGKHGRPKPATRVIDAVDVAATVARAIRRTIGRIPGGAGMAGWVACVGNDKEELMGLDCHADARNDKNFSKVLKCYN